MKLVLILLICIIVLLVLCLVTNKNNENFSNYNSLNKHFTFLSSDEACDLIKDIDYFQNLNKRDILARKYIAKKNTILYFTPTALPCDKGIPIYKLHI